MKKSKFTQEHIAYTLRQVEAGTPVLVSLLASPCSSRIKDKSNNYEIRLAIVGDLWVILRTRLGRKKVIESGKMGKDRERKG